MMFVAAYFFFLSALSVLKCCILGLFTANLEDLWAVAWPPAPRETQICVSLQLTDSVLVFFPGAIPTFTET